MTTVTVEGRDVSDRIDWNAIRRTPAYRRMRLRWLLAEALTGWMRRLPFGQLVASFWGGLIEEGVVQTLKPRWGRLTFGFLNDGVKPSLWHTWHNITHRDVPAYDEITGITTSCDGCAVWPEGAPRSRREAGL